MFLVSYVSVTMIMIEKKTCKSSSDIDTVVQLISLELFEALLIEDDVTLVNLEKQSIETNNRF